MRWHLKLLRCICRLTHLLQAVVGGQHFGTKSLVMSWYQPPSATEEQEKEVENIPPKGEEEDVPVERDVVEEGDELEDELTLDDEGEVSVVIDGLGEEARTLRVS